MKNRDLSMLAIVDSSTIFLVILSENKDLRFRVQQTIVLFNKRIVMMIKLSETF